MLGAGGDDPVEQGGQLGDDAVDVLVAGHPDYQYRSLELEVLQEGVPQLASRVRVVGAVRHQQRVAAQHLEAPLPVHPLQPGDDVVMADVMPLLRQHL